MYKIYLYRDKKGKEPVAEYLQKLSSENSKNSRIKLNKIRDYVKSLSLYGESLGMPYLRHIEGDIWELRPLRDRILFVAWKKDSFFLLHVFTKKTNNVAASL